MLVIVWVRIFTDIQADFLQRDGLGSSIQEMHFSPLCWPIAQTRDDRSQGDDAHGQYGPPCQTVEKRTLAGFETAKNRHVDAAAAIELPSTSNDLRLEIGES